MKALVLATLLLGLAVDGARAADDRLVGPAKARGPDMLVVSGTRVRLSGVQPPEETKQCSSQDGVVPCADLGTATLSRLAGDGPVSCVKERRLGHGYFLGHCRVADGSDPAVALLELGLLQPEPTTAPDAYVKAASVARAAHAGLWGG